MPSRPRLWNSLRCAAWRCGFAVYCVVLMSRNSTNGLMMRIAPGLYGIRRFVSHFASERRGSSQCDLRSLEQWPDEGQINRFKTLKLAMYGRAGTDLLRARMMPVQLIENHASQADPIRCINRTERMSPPERITHVGAIKLSVENDPG